MSIMSTIFFCLFLHLPLFTSIFWDAHASRQAAQKPISCSVAGLLVANDVSRPRAVVVAQRSRRRHRETLLAGAVNHFGGKKRLEDLAKVHFCFLFSVFLWHLKCNKNQQSMQKCGSSSLLLKSWCFLNKRNTTGHQYGRPRLSGPEDLERPEDEVPAARSRNQRLGKRSRNSLISQSQTLKLILKHHEIGFWKSVMFDHVLISIFLDVWLLSL